MKTRFIFILFISGLMLNISAQVHKSSVYDFMDKTGYNIGIDYPSELALNDTISVDIYCVTYLIYRIVGFSESWGIRDIEIYITDLKGNVIAKENTVSGYSQLSFKPKKEDGYRVVMRNANSSISGKTQCRLIIGSK